MQSLKNQVKNDTNVRPKENTNKNGIVRFETDNNDEISVVSNTLLLHINQQLKEILSTSNDCLFAGLSITTVGDLY